MREVTPGDAAVNLATRSFCLPARLIMRGIGTYICLVLALLLGFYLALAPWDHVVEIALAMDGFLGQAPLMDSREFKTTKHLEEVEKPLWIPFLPFAPLTKQNELVARHNESLRDMPEDCATAAAVDIFPNITIAQACRAWCRTQLGPGSSLAHALSPVHWVIVKRSPVYWFNVDYSMCFKAETASWALSWFPYFWHAFLVALIYGSVSFITLARRLQESPEEFLPLGPSPEERSEEFKTYFERRCGLELFANDRAAERTSLMVSVGCLLLEPAGDVLAILGYLRYGQPMYAMVSTFFVVCSCLHACDLFQMNGSEAMAQSFARGFATKALFQHMVSELFEGLGATVVQLYAFLTMRFFICVEDPNMTITFANLLVSACMSLTTTLPNGSQSLWLILNNSGPDFFDNFGDVQDSKKKVPGTWKYMASCSCVLIAVVAAESYHTSYEKMVRHVGSCGLTPSTSELLTGLAALLLLLSILVLVCCGPVIIVLCAVCRPFAWCIGFCFGGCLKSAEPCGACGASDSESESSDSETLTSFVKDPDP